MRERFVGRAVLRRLPGLMAGLVIFGVGIAIMAASGLGLGPWEVFHQGIASRTGLALGTVSILVGIPVLALWWPLGERPGIGTIYLAADLGAGPRDGLMTGLHHRFGWSIRRARTGIELIVLVAGFLMGGTVGLGTILFAFGIGPVVQFMLRIFDPEGRVSRRRRPDLAEELDSPGTVGE